VIVSEWVCLSGVAQPRSAGTQLFNPLTASGDMFATTWGYT